MAMGLGLGGVAYSIATLLLARWVTLGRLLALSGLRGSCGRNRNHAGSTVQRPHVMRLGNY